MSAAKEGLFDHFGARTGFPFRVHDMLQHARGYAPANAGHDTRGIQDWLGKAPSAAIQIYAFRRPPALQPNQNRHSAPKTNPSSRYATSLEGFSGSHIGGRCLGEKLEEDAPRYEPVVVDEKAEDEADPEHEDTEQKRVDNGAIGIVILEARYHHGSHASAHKRQSP